MKVLRCGMIAYKTIIHKKKTRKQLCMNYVDFMFKPVTFFDGCILFDDNVNFSPDISYPAFDKPY